MNRTGRRINHFFRYNIGERNKKKAQGKDGDVVATKRLHLDVCPAPSSYNQKGQFGSILGSLRKGDQPEYECLSVKGTFGELLTLSRETHLFGGAGSSDGRPTPPPGEFRSPRLGS